LAVVHFEREYGCGCGRAEDRAKSRGKSAAGGESTRDGTAAGDLCHEGGDARAELEGSAFPPCGAAA
jgi:hypothetical protein